MADQFNGSSPLAPGFFERLAVNNNKIWFEAHRDEYEELLLEPLKLLVCELADSMLALDPALITIPAADKTISRIYRDTRFSVTNRPTRPASGSPSNAAARTGSRPPAFSSKAYGARS